MIAKDSCDADAASILGRSEGPLESTEQASGSGDGSADKAEFSEDALPSLPADPTARGEVLKDLGEHELPVWGKLDGLADSVNNPAQEDLASLPGAFPLQELLQGEGLVPLLHRDVRRGEDVIDGMVEVSTQGKHASFTTLA